MFVCLVINSIYSGQLFSITINFDLEKHLRKLILIFDNFLNAFWQKRLNLGSPTFCNVSDLTKSKEKALFSKIGATTFGIATLC